MLLCLAGFENVDIQRKEFIISRPVNVIFLNRFSARAAIPANFM